MRSQNKKVIEMQKIQLNPNWKYKEHIASISAYTTCFNCIEGNYPFEEAIRSFAWCDEIVAINALSTDGTKERLEELKKEIPHLVVYDIPLEDIPGKDGQLKSYSRAMCTGEYLIQFDSDEVCVGDINKWKRLIKMFPDNQSLQELIVLEPFGSLTNLRVNDSHNNLKWRLSKSSNVELTHGIPDYDRVEKDGKVWSSGRSDGCFMVSIVNNKIMPSFFLEKEKTAAALKKEHKTEEYKKYIQTLISENHPMILHLGHVNLNKKLSLYLKSWHKWWDELYQKSENIFWSGVKIEDVTQEMVDSKVKELIKDTPAIHVPEIEQLCSTKTG